MPNEWKQKRFGRLTPAKQQLKLSKDVEYEKAVQGLSQPYYQKKRTVGVTPVEETAFLAADKKLWDDYLAWAIGQGLYEEITVEQQLTEAEFALSDMVATVNGLRKELGLSPISIMGV